MANNLTEYDRLQVREDVTSIYETHMRSAYLSEDELEDCREAAIDLIVMAGFDQDDSDHQGDSMDNVVQSLLMVVMARCPQMRDRILGKDADCKIVAEEV
jgi:uncharacterized protein (UPF0276 family)